MPLQSGIVSSNNCLILGLVSRIITAGIGYLIRFVILNNLEYDILGNLGNWTTSLSYICSLGATVFKTYFVKKKNSFFFSWLVIQINEFVLQIPRMEKWTISGKLHSKLRFREQ